MLTAKLCTISSFTAMGIWGLTKKRGDNEAIITTKEVLIAKADALYEQEQYQGVHDLLINYKVMTLCISLINVDNKIEYFYRIAVILKLYGVCVEQCINCLKL